MAREKPKGLRHYFIRGIATLLPLSVTIFIFWLAVDWLGGLLRPLFRMHPWLTRHVPGWGATLAGFVLLTLIVLLAGWVSSGLVGRLAVDWLDGVVKRIPFAKGIYGATREFSDAVFVGRGSLHRTVIAEYPRRGVLAVGFAISDERVELGDGRKALFIFFPTTPHPTTGLLEIVPETDIIETPMSVEEGLKIVVSGGVIRPQSFDDFVRSTT